MTREEAKGNLIHAIRWNDMPKKEALEMAIKALEQEPKTDAIPVSKFNLGDYIVYGTDGNLYEITVSSGKEYEQEPCDNCKYLDGDGCRLLFEQIEYGKASNDCPCEDCISRQAVLDLCDSKDPDYKVIHFKEDVECLPPVTLRSLNSEADREKSKAYCAECDHIEMCSWYPHDGCEWLKTDRYNAGYNAAKREIALSGEYERAYECGKADVQAKTGHWKHNKCDVCGASRPPLFDNYCPNCGTRMVEPREIEVQE